MSVPALSIIVIVYDMSRQARNTLVSLVAPYQRNCSNKDHEIIVVENNSDDELGREAAESVAPNIRYYYREEPGASPVPAVNFALEQCQSPIVGLLMDGARMVTPRVIEYAAMAYRMEPYALVALPGYHLGKKPQHRNPQHDKNTEKEALRSINWPEDGYKLFEIGWFSRGNPQGMLRPIEECHFFFAEREAFSRIDGLDERFDMPGGGPVNAHVWRALGMLPESRIVILAGEGCFHQYHNGLTTAGDRPEVLENIAKGERHLDEIWQGQFRPLARQPVLLGPVSGPASRFVRRSANRAILRQQEKQQDGVPEWEDDCLARYGCGQFQGEGGA